MSDTATLPAAPPAPPSAAPRLLLRVAEVADALALGESTVREMIDRGELPAIHIGRAVRVSVDALRRWVDELDATG